MFVEYVLFDDEGYGFIKKENCIKVLNVYFEFLNIYLDK